MQDIATTYGAIYLQTREDPRISGLLARDPRLDTVATGLLAAVGAGLVAAGIGVIALLV